MQRLFTVEPGVITTCRIFEGQSAGKETGGTNRERGRVEGLLLADRTKLQRPRLEGTMQTHLRIWTPSGRKADGYSSGMLFVCLTCTRSGLVSVGSRPWRVLLLRI